MRGSSVALGQEETRTVRDADRERRAALRHFLRSRRARLSPGDVGLTVGGRRNTPGLRREEVAVLAGVSASWYTWLEQGRDIKVSEGVLDAVSNALNLDRTERAHLYLLAGVNPPAARQEATSEELSRLRLAVEAWQPAPAFMVDRYWNVLVSNAPARTLLGVQDTDSNYLWSFFTDGRNRSRFPHWMDVASRLVGQFRVQAVRFLDDPNFELLARRLCSASPDFDRLWARHETRDTGIATVEVRPAPGRRAAFHHVVMGLHQRSEPLLMLYMPTQIDGDRAG
ncbi:helix-turn-helix transcriptional regulator [Streptomyces sp. Ag109_G2-15]|uniref:helix-turn-helix transcriptional regulator n=1 Tax=Streptomyces sp. Ag109_G2-15 TaxID=1938850 RepID=UPI000BD86319|nr:helix-turn-helix transcriptional regulator [Streptomyces sp. Ag109_G2-15]SOD86994.1 Transcriptional regulator, contains XRE-family HTH domain [Streptomyces sp. Ag109_G2-15]